jgi:RNA polymerase sigma factor (sigma-70 family)
MGGGHSAAILRQLQRLFGGGSVSGLGEGALLERFVSRTDEEAFSAILARHGPMVLGVCRRLLNDPGDIEDAFQATFLVLVKKASTIQDREQLGPWLYGVSRRVAVRARARTARRDAKERRCGDVEEAMMGPDSKAERRELRAVLDDELGRLPEKYRSPIILCYLEGLTHDEAAERLRWPVGTVRSRMSKARDRLRTRLTRRGLALSGAAVASHLASEASATPVPQMLLESTLQAAVGLVSREGTVAGIASASVLSLMREVLKTMYYHKLRMITVGLVVAGVVTGGAAVVARQEGGSTRTPPSTEARAPTPATDQKSKTPEKRDLSGLEAIDDEIRLREKTLDELKKKRQHLLASQKRAEVPQDRAIPAGAPRDVRQNAEQPVGGQTTQNRLFLNGTMLIIVSPKMDRVGVHT